MLWILLWMLSQPINLAASPPVGQFALWRSQEL